MAPDAQVNGKYNWMEYFRLITPFLLMVITFFSAQLTTQLSTIDDKLFQHLTNDEIHVPRSMYVEKASFDLYQKMRDKEMLVLYDNIACIRGDVKAILTEVKDARK